MSEYPSDWRVADLGAVVAEIVAGQSPNRMEHPARNGKKGILKTTAIQWSGFSPLENLEALPDFTANSNTIVRKNDILITKAGPSRRVGVVALSHEDTGTLHVSGKMAAIRTTEEMDPRFLAYQMSQDTFQIQLRGDITGMALSQTNITHDNLLAKSIVVPPLPEQKKIAEILSGIDIAIAIYEQQANALAYMLDALMQEEIVMNTSTKWIKVGDACTAQAGGTPDRSQKEYYEGRIPWVKSGEVKGEDIFQTDESISNEAISNSSAKIVPSGSVLVAMYGATAGQTARLRIDATTNQAVLSLNSKTRELSNDYLYHSVTAFKNQLLLSCQGSGQPNLSSGLIKELEIPLPDPLVQQRISSALDSVRHRVLALRSKINSSKSLKNSIASDLLSGRKRVSI
jgi:type I restriction enzyme, S subunit